MAKGNVLERVGFVLEKYQDGDDRFVDLLRRVKKALETSVMDRVPAPQIRPYKNQPRKYFDPDKIKQMADSIDVTAQIQAGMIRKIPRAEWVPPVRYELVDGERRWRGVNLIPEERRPLYKAEIIEADDEVVQFLIAGMANFNREGHQPLETADTIDRYRKFGIPMEAVADLLGITAGWAYNVHGLLRLPDPIKEMLKPREKKKDQSEKEKQKQGPQIPVAAAIHISKLPNPKRQVELALKVVRGEITLGRLRGEILRSAEETGTPIRLREISPLRKWQSREEKMRAIIRFASNLEEMLKTIEVQNIMKAHRSETTDFLRQLKTGSASLERCEALVLQVSKK